MNKRILGLLFVTLFVIMVGFSVLFPVEAFYIQSFGASARSMGILIMLFSLGQFSFSPLWGRLSDRIGRRPVIMIGLAGYGIATLLFGLSTQLWQLFATRVLAGVLSAAALPTAMAVIADSTDEEHRARGMGLLGAAFGLGVIFGPALGGVLGQHNLSLPYYVTAALACANLVWVYFSLPESLPPERRGARTHQESLWKNFRRATSVLYLLSLLASISLAGLETTFGFMAAERLGLEPQQVGWLFMIMGIAGAAVQGGLIGPLKRRFGERRLIPLGLAISAAGFAWTAFAWSPLAAALSISVFSVGNGLVRPSNLSLVTRRSITGHGGAVGLLSSFDSMGRIVGPAVAGRLYEVRDSYPFLVGAVLSLVAAALFLGLDREDGRA